MNSGEVVVEFDQHAVEPRGENRVNEAAQLLEQPQVQRQRIPVARESQNRDIPARRGAYQRHNHHRDTEMRRDLELWMREIAMKNGEDPEQPPEISERNPLECGARAPGFRQPARSGSSRLAVCLGIRVKVPPWCPAA